MASRVGRSGAADVRREDDVLEPEQPWRDLWLVLEDVEARGGERPVFERGRQGALVDAGAARGVHEDGARLHPPQAAGVQEVAGLRGERAMERDEVRSLEELVERDALGAELARDFVRGGASRGVEHGHSEAARAAGHGLADPSEADDAQGGAVDRRAEEEGRRPAGEAAAAADEAIALGDAARGGEQQAEGPRRRWPR